MCIAILKLKDSVITDEQLRTSFRRNNDGGGIAYIVDNQLIIEKGYFNEDEFVNAVRRAESMTDNNMLIHCRIGTSGGRNERNCHPFRVSDNVAMIHNGVISKFNGKEADNSDTAIYVRDILAKISDEDLIHNDVIKYLVESDIGCGNKFVLMNNKGEYTIFNEKSGHWKDGIWFSNNTYEPIKYTYWNGGSTYTKPSTDTQMSFFKNDLVSLLSPSEKKAVESMIKNLSPSDVLKIGEYPIVDITGLAVTISGDSDTGEFLMDLDEELYDQWLEVYTGVVLESLDDLDDLDILKLGSNPYMSVENGHVQFAWSNKDNKEMCQLSDYRTLEDLHDKYMNVFEEIIKKVECGDLAEDELAWLETTVKSAIDDLDETDFAYLIGTKPMFDFDSRSIELSGHVFLINISDDVMEYYKQKEKEAMSRIQVSSVNIA